MYHKPPLAVKSDYAGKMGVGRLMVRLAVLVALVSLTALLAYRIRTVSLHDKRTLKRYNRVVSVHAEMYGVHFSDSETDGESSVFYKEAVKDRELFFAHPRTVRPLKDLLKAPWMVPLQSVLKDMTGKQVNVVLADSKYLPSVINWLIAALVQATPPLNNVLVIALDKPLHLFLKDKGIPLVYVDPWSVIDQDARLAGTYAHIWVTRLAIFRLLNYWGYDVANYDTDAVVLKNLQPLFDKYRDSDVIGSSGSFPQKLGRKWGQTFCMGVSLFRSTKKTDLLWSMMSQLTLNKSDDQVRMNYALDQCNVTWRQEEGGVATHGVCRNGLKVTILSNRVICRHCSSSKATNYYVWHRLASKGKMDRKTAVAKLGKAWFLRDGWNATNHMAVGRKLTGINWLRSITSTN